MANKWCGVMTTESFSVASRGGSGCQELVLALKNAG
jgi:hypothetical protein